MRPVEVPDLPPSLGWRRLTWIAVEPALDVVIEVLLRPEHPGQRLPQHERAVAVEAESRVQLVAGLPTRGHDLFPRLVQRTALRRESQPDLDALARFCLELVVQRGLRPDQIGVHARRSVHDVVADPVFREGGAVDNAEVLEAALKFGRQGVEAIGGAKGREDRGIFDGDRVVQEIPLAGETLGHLHLVRVEQTALIEPRQVVERDRLNHERIAFPASH